MPSKGLSGHAKEISTILNLAVNSLRLNSLTIEEKPDKGPPIKKSIRPQIHAILHAPKASFKSTILNAIAETHKVHPITGITYPGLIGSADRQTGAYIPAAAWDYRGKPLILDEWTENKDREKLINALLQICEDGKYVRKIGIKTNEFKQKRGGHSIQVKDGWIVLQSRVMMLLATMHDIRRSTNKDVQALVSRSIPYSYSLSDIEIEKVMQGNPLYIPETWDFNPDAYINNEIFSRIIASARKSQQAIRSRTIGDICRAWALVGWNDEIFQLIMDSKDRAEIEFQISWEQYVKKIRGFSMHDF